MDPLLWELYGAGSNDDEVSVILRLKKAEAPPKNTEIISVFRNPSGEAIVTARIKRGDILEVWASPEVFSVKAPQALSWPSPFDDAIAFDESESVLGSSWPYVQSREDIPEDGSGVVVGLPDYGFDFTHENLRKADGTTRLLALWNQNGEEGPSPSPYGYGQVFYRDTINAALKTSDPCKTLGYHPAMGDPRGYGAHGTHVADILAGNRRVPGSEVGLASGADIVFVQLARQRLGELANFGDSVCLLEALDFCRRIAGDRPCVINLSAGMCGGSHCDKLPFTKAVDAMVTERPGIAFIQSVGNYAHSAMHTHLRLGPNRRRVLYWLISKRDRTPNELEIWYSGRDVIDLTIIAPGGRRFTVPLGKRIRLVERGTHFGNLYHRRHEPNTGLNHIDIFLYTSAPKGRWRVALHGQQIVDGRLHAWIERDASGLHQSRFSRRQATSRYTTNTIANGDFAIAVGAHDSEYRPTIFSSRGPTSDGRLKPEISAPGSQIKAARSMPLDGWHGESRLCVKSGTSMAAPWVSGVVTLMMQAAGRPMTIHEVRNILISTADPLPGRPGHSSTRLGYGYLNPAAAIAAARRLNAVNAVMDRDDERAQAKDNASGKGGQRMKQQGYEMQGDMERQLQDSEQAQFAHARELEEELIDPEQEEFEIAEDIEEEFEAFEHEQFAIAGELEEELIDPEQEEFEIAEDLEDEIAEELAASVDDAVEDTEEDEELAASEDEATEEFEEDEELTASVDDAVEDTEEDEELAASEDEATEEFEEDEELTASVDDAVEEMEEDDGLAASVDDAVEEMEEDEELAASEDEATEEFEEDEELAASVDEAVEEMEEDEELAASEDEAIEKFEEDEELAESIDEELEGMTADEGLADRIDEAVEDVADDEALTQTVDQAVEDIEVAEDQDENDDEKIARVADRKESAESIYEDVEGDIDDEEQEARSLSEVYDLLDELAEQEWGNG